MVATLRRSSIRPFVQEPINILSSLISVILVPGFKSGIGAWTQSSADDINWTVDANGTPSNNTGPSSAIQGSNYIYVEASGNGTGFPNKRAIITSPYFDLSSVTEANFTFKYHMFGSTNGGSVDLEVSNDEGATWISLWNQTGNQGNQWLTVNIDLAAYIGGGIQLRFNRITGGTWQSDVAIDDISLTEGGTTPVDCDTLNFNDYTLNSFSTQDASGTKYVSTGGLIIDAYAGVGRNLFGSDSPVLVPRVGVNVGWRF